MSTKFVPRLVSKTIKAVEQSEGVGARVRRSIGTIGMRNYTPFLMLDHFKVSPDAGFPDHPHRGQETITYMMKGNVDHEDFTGASGTLGPGDLQFMTAGRGVVHAEMPRVNKDLDGDLQMVEGLQLWVDLPEKLKDTDPRYRDLRKNEIPVIHPSKDVEIKVISGESHGTESVKDLAYTPIWFFDMTVKPGGRVLQQMPKSFNVFLYILSGEVVVQGKTYPAFTNIFFDKEGDGVEVSVSSESKTDAQFAIIGGEILDQKIVQHGPFVSTSREGIMQAFSDYQTGSHGFERAVGWESKIGQRMLKHH